MPQDFAWIDSLGFPDVAKLPFVKVIIGTDEKYPVIQHGFLQGETADSFRVFVVEGEPLEFLRQRPQDYEQAKHFARHEPADLTTYAAAELQAEQDWYHRGGGASRLPQDGLDYPTHFTLLARWLSQRGEEDLAKKLHQAAASADFKKRGWIRSGGGVPEDLQNFMRLDMAAVCFFRAVNSVGDPRLSREAIAARCAFIADKLPDTPWSPLARELQREMENLAAEEKARPWLADDQVARLAPAEQAAVWVARLPVQNGHQWMTPGYADPFQTSDHNSPAHRLLALGRAAVPALIGALDDHRFTRTVGIGAHVLKLDAVMRVNAVALRVLNAIARRDFPQPKNFYNPTPDDIATARPAIEAWWAEAQKKTDEEMLVEGLRAGEQRCLQDAQAYVVREGAKAVPALAAGLAQARYDSTRETLLRYLDAIPGDAPVETLLQHMRGASVRKQRVQAAASLLRRNHPEAREAMLAEWRKLSQERGRTMFSDGFCPLLALLIHEGEIKSLHLITDQWQSWTPDQRADFCQWAAVDKVKGVKDIYRKVSDGWQHDWQSLSMVPNLDAKPNFGGLSGIGWVSFSPAASAKDRPSPPAELGALFQRILARGMEDEDRVVGPNWAAKTEPWDDFRICDWAAFYFARSWPSFGRFDHRASRITRDRQRITVLNAWRKSQNLQPLPVPEAPASAPREAALATVILRVTLTWPDDVPQPAAMAEIEALKGKPLSPDTLTQALHGIVEQSMAQCESIEVNIERDEFQPGLSLNLRAWKLMPPGQDREWIGHLAHAVIAGGGLYSQDGHKRPQYLTKSSWDEPSKQIRKGVSAIVEADSQAVAELVIAFGRRGERAE